MKRQVLVILGALCLWVAPAAFAQESPDVSKLTSALTAFTDKVPAALPFAASAGLDWSNAYLGQVIDGDFPFIHFGAGAQLGLTTIPGDAMYPILDALGAEIPPVVSSLGAFPLPFVLANVRVGGLILPFDVGVKAGYLPPGLGKVGDFDIRYQNVGADFRLNLIKSNFLLPDISIGGGANLLDAGVAFKPKAPVRFMSNGTALKIEKPTVDLGFNAFEFEGKAQVSKTLLYIVTPYVGATVMSGTAKASTDVKGKAYTQGNKSLNDFSGIIGSKVSSSGFTVAKDAATFGIKAFAGTSLNIVILKIDVQGMYNITDGALGGSLGIRAQL